MKVVFVGNPGAGKSTLLNSLLGKPRFASGISIGTGLTTRTEVHQEEGVQYVDTPGLDDFLTREVAASQISAALSGSGPLQLVFVCTLESGSVKPADVATIDAILSALESAGTHVRNRFCVIVNKCSPNEMQKLTTEARERLRNDFSCGRGNPHIEFLPLIPEACEQSGALVVTPQFMENVLTKTPRIELRPGAKVQVRAENFLQMLNRLQGRLNEQRSLLAMMSVGGLAYRRKNRLFKIVGAAFTLVAAIGMVRFLLRKNSSALIREVSVTIPSPTPTRAPGLFNWSSLR